MRDGDGDSDGRPAKRSLVPLLAALAGLAVGGAGGLGVGFAGGYAVKAGKPVAVVEPAGPPVAVSTASAAAGRNKYTREEVRKLVWGKTPAGVLAALGKPVKTRAYHDDGQTVREEVWGYADLAYDPVSGANDAVVVLTWAAGNTPTVRDVAFR